jgi:hypothetical protein
MFTITRSLNRAVAVLCLLASSLSAQTVTADFASRKGSTPVIPPGIVAVGGMNNLTATPMAMMVGAGLDQTRMFLALDVIYKTTTPNFTAPDTLLARMKTAGVHGIGVLVGTPPALGASYCAAPDPQQWTTLATTIVAHIDQKYPGVIDRYEVWNEPDAVATLCPATGVSALTTYLGIYAAAAPAIRAQTKADGLTVRVGGPTLASPGRNTSWITSLVTTPTTAPYVDFVSYHLYITGQTEISNGMTWAQLYGYSQSATSGLAHYYKVIEPLVRAGIQPGAATTPIYVTEYNDNWAFALDCCRNDPSYGPLWNALAIADHLNVVYSGAKSVPSQLFYFNATSSKYFCVLGAIDAAMDCLPSASDPYPQFYAFKLFASYLGLHDGGSMASSVTTASGLVTTAFYTSKADDLVLINPTATDVTTTVAFNNPGLVSPAATSFLLAKAQITSTPLTLTAVGSNYTAQTTVPAYSTLAISMTGSTQIAAPPSGLQVQLLP